jgi:hypothetical protein
VVLDELAEAKALEARLPRQPLERRVSQDVRLVAGVLQGRRRGAAIEEVAREKAFMVGRDG